LNLGGHSHFAVGIAPSAGVPKRVQELTGDKLNLKALEQMQSALVSATVSSALDLEVLAFFATEAAAKEAKADLDALKIFATGGGLAHLKERLATETDGEKIYADLESAPKSVSIEQNGAEVVVRGKLPLRAGVTLFLLAARSGP
jgi:hypothetical protein